MEIRLLGPVEVQVGEEPAPVPGAGERELLALLALSAGHVVPVSTLVDALWEDDLPADPHNALQVRVSKLRRALDRARLAGVLVTRAPGYVLDVPAERVDAQRFSAGVTRARALATSDPVAAERLYRGALALWRGPALSEFADAEWAALEAARLTELQLAAREELLDLELADGRHSEVLGELEALATAHPLRERLHGRLMLALYRAGRQADALAAYQRAREVLDAELGLAPSTELRSLQQAILQQRPELEAPARAPRARAPAAGRLPPRLTSFVGREADLHRLGALLREHRLVTVTGPGGVGKTSLALEVARAVEDEHPDGVGFVRLSGVTDHDHVPRAVLAALDVRDVPTVAAADHVVGRLRDRSVLLVLDNCEHVADACAVLAERMLESCPRVRLLATSREPLAARGEVLYSVGPLTVPPDTSDGAQLSASAAVRLFVDRARAVLPSLELDGDDVAAAAEICRRLDGIPLAIELAAARVSALPVPELARRMEDRFAILTSGLRTAELRQRTLRATVDWSHDLLTEPERVLLRRLSVFSGSWPLDAARAVASDETLDPAVVVDALARLVDRSLVAIDRATGPRYHLLETVREYARERLAEAGETEQLARAHVAYLTDLVQRAEHELRGDGQGRWLPRLTLERDDLETALAWCTSHATTEPDLGLQLVGALGWYWYFATRPDGGARVAAMLAAAGGGSAGARARALQALAVAARPGACIVHPAPRCADAAAESRLLFEELGDEFRAALSTTLLAVEAIGTNEQRTASRSLDEAEREFERVGDRWCSALVQFVRMELQAAAGDIDSATAVGQGALDRFRKLGDQWGVSAVQLHLAIALHRSGRLPEALAMYEGALSSGREVGPANTIQYALAGAGHAALSLGDRQRAARLFAESHAVGRELGAEGNPRAAVGEGLLAREEGDVVAARSHLTRAVRMLSGQSEPEWLATALVGLGHLAQLSGDLAGADCSHRRAWRAAPGHAAALEGLACVAAERGHGSGAARLLGAAAAWRARRHRPLFGPEAVDAMRAEGTARALAGDEAFEVSYAAGAARPDACVPDDGDAQAAAPQAMQAARSVGP